VHIPDKEQLLHLTAFEALYSDALIAFTLEMIPLIIETGASISLIPHWTNFTSDFKPV